MLSLRVFIKRAFLLRSYRTHMTGSKKKHDSYSQHNHSSVRVYEKENIINMFFFSRGTTNFRILYIFSIRVTRSPSESPDSETPRGPYWFPRQSTDPLARVRGRVAPSVSRDTSTDTVAWPLLVKAQKTNVIRVLRKKKHNMQNYCLCTLLLLLLRLHSPASPMITVGADRVVRGGMAAGGFMSVFVAAAAAAAAAADANPAPPMSSGRTPLMRHTDRTAAAAAAAALLGGAVDAGEEDVCVPAFQNADDTDVTTDCRRCCWYCCCVTDMESVAEGVLHRDDCCCCCCWCCWWWWWWSDCCWCWGGVVVVWAADDDQVIDGDDEDDDDDDDSGGGGGGGDLTTQLMGLVITTDSRLCCCCCCAAAAAAAAAAMATATADGDDGPALLWSAVVVPFSYPVPTVSFLQSSDITSSLTFTRSPTSFGSCPLSVVMLPHSGDDAILQIVKPLHYTVPYRYCVITIVLWRCCNNKMIVVHTLNRSRHVHIRRVIFAQDGRDKSTGHHAAVRHSNTNRQIDLR